MLRIKSKFKIGKRLGPIVFDQCQTQKFALSEARSRKARKRRPRGLSDYGKQLLEKQRMRYTYGLSERQLTRYVKEAMNTPDQVKTLHGILERRLDNVMYRLALAPTRRAARQMVSHGHITVDNKRTTSPSYQIRKGDVLAVREGSREKALFQGVLEDSPGVAVPNWLKLDVKKLQATITGEPSYDPSDSVLDYAAIFEFYSR